MAQLGRPPKAPKIEAVELVDGSNLMMMTTRLKPLLKCGWRLKGPIQYSPGPYYLATLVREYAPEDSGDRASS